MAKTIVGIDIGACELKLAVCAGNEVRRVIVADMPDNLERDGRIISPVAMAEFMGDVAKKEKVSTGKCAVILPSSVAYTRSVTLPAMTVDKLKINLPYEFRDFVTQEKDKYFYDYLVQNRIDGEDGKPKEFELMAAVALKETIAQYTMMCRRAGFRLVTAIPEEFAYMNIIRMHEQRISGANKNEEYGILDLGHTASRLHIFNGTKHMVSRIIEVGSYMLDVAISEKNSIDIHIARAHKVANTNDELYSDTCMSIYYSIAMELLRAINFYRFNTQDSNLTNIYVCGGGAKIAPLISLLSDELVDITIRNIRDILPASAGKDDDAMLCQLAIGVTMQ